MNINPLVKTGLSTLNIPIFPDHYEGDLIEYIVFNYSLENTDIFADGTDITDITEIQVHYFTKSNPQIKKKAIRRLLRASGFTILNTTQFYENDTKFTHVIVECQIGGEINDEEED